MFGIGIPSSEESSTGLVAAMEFGISLHADQDGSRCVGGYQLDTSANKARIAVVVGVVV